MLTALIALYTLGFGMFFTLHQVFDGGVIYATRKEGPLVGLLISAVWPLVVAIFFVIAIVHVIRKGG